ncbi:MAG: tetratricopeptide repeat protein [Candidatus Lambdaproteobacteria bacterium]|nr:tetratricopeptide repeat protein [Candidatus Lambdaproteobacteria bacterium]
MTIIDANPVQTIVATDANFQALVLEKSHEIPMLVDFWAPWCGPCKVISPVLEKLAHEYGGRFQLVKVNMDENPMLAQALRIQSIPNVKLIINGALQDEFAGAYPEPEVRRFLDRNLPTAADQAAVSGLHEMASGDQQAAMARFREVLKGDPRNAAALVGLGHCHIAAGDVDEARQLAAQVDESALDRLPERKQVEAQLAVLRGKILLAEHAGDMEAMKARVTADPNDLEARCALASSLALQGHYAPALEQFLQIVQKNRKFREDIGRRGMLAVFNLLPADSPLLGEYRKKLSSYLFS